MWQYFAVIHLSLQPVHVNAAAKETKAESKTLAVLLPCREKGSKTTKIWLRRLQQYLYYHYKSGQSKSQFKILTLFSCHARERLAIMERPDLAGILSFEPRPSKASVELKENILDNFDKLLSVFLGNFGGHVELFSDTDNLLSECRGFYTLS